ncbi:MAG: hypothetical protein D3906_14420 [Candidatus Electrothrix sp. AUS1_2]|nr:hypothetical protein [Candidatus Electrothrix sp. AUS1_2]
MKKIIKKLCNLSLVAALFGCQQGPFTLDTYNKSLMHKESGLYVHRELELRVNAARFRTPPEGAAPGAVSELEASEFTPLSASSFYFAPVNDQQDGDTLLWRGVQHISKYAADGKTSIGGVIGSR